MDVVHKVTLSSGKVVLLRDPKMKHMRLAEKLSNNSQGMAFQEELIKQLLYKVDDSEVKKPDLLDLDDMFSAAEVLQLGNAIAQLLGNENGTKMKLEQVFGGA